MRRLAIAFLLLLLAPASAGAAKRTLAPGSWSYFGDPRAVYANGTTFVGWITPDGHVQVASLKDGEFHRRTLDYMGTDDHNNPSLYVRRDGRIVAFYTPHGTLEGSASERHRMFWRITKNAYDIRAWGPVHYFRQNTAPVPGNGDRGFTYPNPVRIGNEVWLFWRGGSWWPTLSRTKDFQHWSKPINVVSSINGQRPYAKYEGDGQNVYMAFTRAHPNSLTTGIWFLQINKDGSVRKANGTKVGSLGHAVSTKDSDPVYRYSSSQGRAWVMDIAVDSEKRPVIVYYRRQQEGGDTYRYARWDGAHWVDRPIVSAGKPWHSSGYYQGGITLDHEDPSVVYLSRRVPFDGQYQIEIWTTADQGVTWESRALTDGKRDMHWRPVSPRGLVDGVQVFWWSGKYVNFRDYDTNIVVGMKRAAARRAAAKRAADARARARR